MSTGTREPLKAGRPHMPGYGTERCEAGLLPWSWADDKLRTTMNYWVATVRPDGRPHVMPVWATWDGEALWFGSTHASRKMRNLRADPRCTVTIDNALDPVVLDGVAEFVTDPEAVATYVETANAKYASAYSYDPDVNAIVAIRPAWAFGMRAEDFTGTPTRWQW
ncbi:TIGR03618 family F420-dependent PPOX class oxidoreductase [Amycolatopsis thailandensis]|uniref:TIGR03618 family F420-dependent PPOX class oxidoreductase n=1 Tax=Amycolatopsis thailandensis TaxID=589330 RepID=UPI00365157FC